MKPKTKNDLSLSFLKGCVHEMLLAARVTPVIYFAPVVGAIAGVVAQCNKMQPQPIKKPKLA